MTDKISKENTIILNKLRIIAKSPSKIRIADHRNQQNWILGINQEKYRKLNVDNQAIARRISNAHSKINFNRFEEDYKKSGKYSDLRRKIKHRSSSSLGEIKEKAYLVNK